MTSPFDRHQLGIIPFLSGCNFIITALFERYYLIQTAMNEPLLYSQGQQFHGRGLLIPERHFFGQGADTASGYVPPQK